MNKFKRIICCLVMPILAMVGLAGCGNNRDALTVQNRYTQMIQDHGDMFATNADGTKSDKVKVSYNSGEMKKLEDLSDNSSQFLTDYNLYARYAALKELQGNPTVFIVSQRTSSIQHADLILVLEDGELVGKGTHKELLDSCEVYNEIYMSQYKKEEV